MKNLDYSKISNVKLDGIDTRDWPDMCDAYIESAYYDGEEMTDEQLDEINDDKDFVYQKVMNYLF